MVTCGSRRESTLDPGIQQVGWSGTLSAQVVGESGEVLKRSATSPTSKSNLDRSRELEAKVSQVVTEAASGGGSCSQRSPPDALCCCSRRSSIRQSPSPKCCRILASLPLCRGSGYRRRERSAWRGRGTVLGQGGRGYLARPAPVPHQARPEPTF